MKKTLLLTTIAATLLVCSCRASIDTPIQTVDHKSYAEKISESLQATEWFYTYQEIQPRKNSGCIIEFYTYEPIKSHSTWKCEKVEDEINCEQLNVVYF